jgi:hypothetical protein
VARDILTNAAQQLALLVASVRAQLFADGEQTAVAFIGGVFRSPILRERFRQIIELEPGNHCGEPRYGPAAGALLEAYRSAGLQIRLTNVTEHTI